MKFFLKILLVVFITFVANLKVASATITITNIQEIAISFSFYKEILRTTFKVFESDLANYCQNKQDLVDYTNRDERVKPNAAKTGDVNWSKEYGLVRYETKDDEVYELIYKTK